MTVGVMPAERDTQVPRARNGARGCGPGSRILRVAQFRDDRCGVIHHARSSARRHLSPGDPGCGRLRVSLPATGRPLAAIERGKETANWHRGRVLMRPSPRSHRITADGNAHRAVAGLNGAGAENAVTRVPQGSPGTRAGSQGARRGSQGGSSKAFRAGWYRPRAAEQAPAYPSHPRPFCRGRTARGCE
jgi:hypothetical protein